MTLTFLSFIVLLVSFASAMLSMWQLSKESSLNSKVERFLLSYSRFVGTLLGKLITLVKRAEPRSRRFGPIFESDDEILLRERTVLALMEDLAANHSKWTITASQAAADANRLNEQLDAFAKALASSSFPAKNTVRLSTLDLSTSDFSKKRSFNARAAA
jgi:hypothetical protein